MNDIYTRNSNGSINNYISNKKNDNIKDNISLPSKSPANAVKASVSDNNLVQISEKNQNLINVKKAKSALDYSLKDFSEDEKSQMIIALSTVNFIIEHETNDKTPLSTNCLEQPFSFIDYASELVKYAEKLQKTSPGFLPSNFVDFCKKYQENLKNFGCS